MLSPIEEMNKRSCLFQTARSPTPADRRFRNEFTEDATHDDDGQTLPLKFQIKNAPRLSARQWA